MPETIDLRPCPFCGSGDVTLSNGYDEDGNWVVLCGKCKSSGGFCTEKVKAIERWQSRAGLPRATADDESLLIALKAAANYICRAQSDHYDAETRDTIIKALTYEINALEATPRATGETTVEAALAELREMFPLPHDLRIALSDYGRVINAEIYRDARLMAKGSTLADCMAQVRAATRTEGEGEKL